MRLPRRNPHLSTVLPGWNGQPLDAAGRYRNLYGSSERGFADVWRWQTGPKPQKAEKKADRWRLDVRPDLSFFERPADEDRLTWLGHCTFLIRLGGKTILTDPVLDHLGPVRRRCALPFPAERLTGLDYILVSHNHRDHADRSTLLRLHRQNPHATVLTGLRTGHRLLGHWLPGLKYQEAGWWQRYDTGPTGLEIVYLPAQHWARRGLFDLNDMLWGSYLLRGHGKTLFFGADSGYAAHFRDIAAAFPGIDHCLLGIGAYAPRWFMQPSHTDPADAVQACHDLGARHLVPMHYGAYDLSDEPFGEPLRRIRALEGSLQAELHCLTPGETLTL
jgi:L-ascorbate metabolism protein UlaG (beta-lactamase superfamily)